MPTTWSRRRSTSLNYDNLGETVTPDVIVRAARAGMMQKIRTEAHATRTLALRNSALQSSAPQSSHVVRTAPSVWTTPTPRPSRIGWDRSAGNGACDICQTGHHGPCHLLGGIGRRVNGHEKKILYDAFMKEKGGAPNLSRRAKVDLGVQVVKIQGWELRELRGGDHGRMSVPSVGPSQQTHLERTKLQRNTAGTHRHRKRQQEGRQVRGNVQQCSRRVFRMFSLGRS